MLVTQKSSLHRKYVPLIFLSSKDQFLTPLKCFPKKPQRWVVLWKVVKKERLQGQWIRVNLEFFGTEDVVVRELFCVYYITFSFSIWKTLADDILVWTEKNIITLASSDSRPSSIIFYQLYYKKNYGSPMPWDRPPFLGTRKELVI